MKPIFMTPADGVSFLTIPDDRFTTARISVSIYLPLREETAGAVAMLPFLLRRGCRRLDNVTAFHHALDSLYGANIDGYVTSAGETQIVNMTMSCIDDRFALQNEAVAAQCADLLLDVLFDPALEDGVFRSEDVEQERRCTLESIAAEINDKRRYAVSRLKAILCEGEPYAVSKYGTAKQVEALTADELTAMWRQMLKSAPIRIIYQGSGDGDAVRKAFAEKLAERQVTALPPVVKAAAKDTVARVNEQMGVNQCQLVLGLRTAILGDDPRSDAMRMACGILGGTPHSLLFVHVREEHSLCYYCSSRYDRHKGIVIIDSGVSPDKLEQAEAEILRQLADLQNGNFDDDMIDNTRLSLIDALNGAGDSAAATAEWFSAQGPEGFRSPEDVIEGIRRVTREQIIEAAKTLQYDSVFTLTPHGKEETA